MRTRDLYQIVTDKIVEALENGLVPWKKPWTSFGAHRNAKTGREYRGVNVLLLSLAAQARGYDYPLWLTFNQVKELGGAVRAGERTTLVVFWRVLEKETGEKDENGDDVVAEIPVLRYYNVFNLAQTTGLEHLTPTGAATHATIADAEAVWQNYAIAPRLRHGGSAAYYSPALDQIQMPPKTAFATAASYYGVLFHEAIHSTGHKARLNRATLTQMGKFGDENYSSEELVAELGAAMLCARAGLEPDIANSAAYIRGWLRALRDDKKLIVIAAQRAQRACDFITSDATILDEAPAAAAEMRLPELIA